MKNILYLIFLTISVIISTSLKAQWYPMGLPIYGENINDLSGSAISISSDGLTLAIGSRLNDGNGIESGSVRVYKYISNNWIQLGNDIDGEDTGDQSGYSLSLSENGLILAIGSPYSYPTGHVRVFNFNGTDWVQIGSNINGLSNGNSGMSVSLSADGLTLATGSPNSGEAGLNSGQVSIFKYNGLIWEQQGLSINGEAPGDYCGFSISLSDDGLIIAIGSLYNGSSNYEAGHVRVFQFNGVNWVQIGVDIDGEASQDFSGCSVSLSSDGLILAIGAPGNDGSAPDAGHVRIYQFGGVNWVQMGVDIDGGSSGENSGYSVSLSDDGLTVAIGSSFNNSAAVKIYEYNGSSWMQKGGNINISSSNELLGYPVALNANGQIVAAGVPPFTFENTFGFTKIFSFCKNLPDTISLAICTGDSIEINGTIYNTLNSAGIETLIGAGMNGCDSTIIINISEISNIDNTISYNENGGLEANQMGAFYRWLDCENGYAVIPNETSQSLDGSYLGSFAVEITTGSCIDTSDCGFLVITGINQSKLDIINIYPNPSGGLFFINSMIEKELIQTIDLINLQGKFIKTISVTENPINISDCENGFYFLKISTNENVFIAKILKK
jgi:hypothetical protein